MGTRFNPIGLCSSGLQGYRPFVFGNSLSPPWESEKHKASARISSLGGGKCSFVFSITFYTFSHVDIFLLKISVVCLVHMCFFFLFFCMFPRYCVLP